MKVVYTVKSYVLCVYVFFLGDLVLIHGVVFYALGIVSLHAFLVSVGFTTHTARIKELRLYRGFVRNDRIHGRLIGY